MKPSCWMHQLDLGLGRCCPTHHKGHLSFEIAVNCVCESYVPFYLSIMWFAVAYSLAFPFFIFLKIILYQTVVVMLIWLKKTFLLIIFLFYL